MTALNIKLTYTIKFNLERNQYEQYAQYTTADPRYRQFIPNIEQPARFTGTHDLDTEEYIDEADYLTTNYSAFADTVLLFVNGGLGTSHTPGIRVAVDQEVVDALALKVGLNVSVAALSTPTLVTSTSGGGTQGHASKLTFISASLKSGVTVNVLTGATSVSEIVAEICATNSSTAGDWINAGKVDTEQAVSLAIALGMNSANIAPTGFLLPPGWYYRFRKSGTGTHAESYIAGTISTFN